jgi:hypothetical protein
MGLDTYFARKREKSVSLSIVISIENLAICWKLRVSDGTLREFWKISNYFLEFPLGKNSFGADNQQGRSLTERYTMSTAIRADIELEGTVKQTSDGLIFTGHTVFGGKEYPYTETRLDGVLAPQLPSGRRFILTIHIID